MSISQSLYRGTVLEGELIDDLFLVSDFLVYLQKNITKFQLDQRINLLVSILTEPNYHFDSVLDPFRITVKDFVESNELISFLHDYLPKLPYCQKVTGLIFRPNENSNKNLMYNFHQKYQVPSPTSGLSPTINPIMTNVTHPDVSHIISHVISHVINTAQHTEVHFLLFDAGNPDDYSLKLLDEHGQLFDYDYALVTDMKTSQMLQKIFNETDESSKRSGICFMCRYIPSFKKWKPITYGGFNLPDNIIDLQ